MDTPEQHHCGTVSSIQNFVGHLETAAIDTKHLLKKVGAWKDFGATGWGRDGTEAIFHSRGTIHHATNTTAQDPLLAGSTDDVKELLDEICATDYDFPLLSGPSTLP